MVLTAHPLACWSYEAKGLLLCPSSCKVFLTELIHFRMWWNASLSTTSFSNSSCGLRGFSSHLTWDLAFSYSQILGWSPLKALQGWVCERPAVWCLACQWGCLTLMYFGAWYVTPGWIPYVAVSCTAPDLFLRECFRRPKGRRQDCSWPNPGYYVTIFPLRSVCCKAKRL